MMNKESKKNYMGMYQSYYSGIIRETKNMYRDIIEFIEKSPQLNKYLKNIKFKNIIDQILESENENFMMKMISDTSLLSLLISKNIDQKTKMPKYWMNNNQYYSDLMQTFLKTKRYAQHDDVFVKMPSIVKFLIPVKCPASPEEEV